MVCTDGPRTNGYNQIQRIYQALSTYIRNAELSLRPQNPSPKYSMCQIVKYLIYLLQNLYRNKFNYVNVNKMVSYLTFNCFVFKEKVFM